MQRHFAIYLLVLISLFLAPIAKAQIVIAQDSSLERLLKQYFIGNDVVAYNFKFKGNPIAIASFKAQNDLLKIAEGFVLSTGKTTDIAHENDANNQWSSNGTSGDKDLNRIARGITVDAAIIEFDFIPLKNKISFNYFFASEEYMEYADSKYNDVFAFIVNGQGVRKKNLALLPDNKTIVSVNNLNQFKNKEFYINNNVFSKTGEKLNKNSKKLKRFNSELINYFQYDGLTIPMQASCNVVPGKKYHIKIALADVGDFKYDSGIFFEKGSFATQQDSSAKFNTVYIFKPEDTIKVAAPNITKSDSIKKELVINNTISSKEPLKTNSLPKSTLSNKRQNDVINISNIYFESDSYVIPDSSAKMLDKLALQLIKNKNYYIEIFGYTDSTGKVEYNRTLSVNRAKAVFNYLIIKKVDEDKINFEGFGSNKAVTNNTTDKNRLRNRRVEIVLKQENTEK